VKGESREEVRESQEMESQTQFFESRKSAERKLTSGLRSSWILFTKVRKGVVAADKGQINCGSSNSGPSTADHLPGESIRASEGGRVMCECRIERGKGQENLRKQKSRTIFESLESAERKKVAKSAASRKERGEKANATTRKGTKARGVRQSQKRGAKR